MKVTKEKKAKKVLNFYKTAFGIYPLYRVVVDGTFINVALSQRINLRDDLPSLCQAKAIPVTTACIMGELKELIDTFRGAFLAGKNFERVKCPHMHDPVSGAECIEDLIANGNPKRYIIATQDTDLRRHIRAQPGIPLVVVSGSALTLERPSAVSVSTWQAVEESKLSGQVGKKRAAPNSSEEDASVKKKSKRPKGPNPLSMKKSKRAGEVEEVEEVVKKKNRRKLRPRKSGGTRAEPVPIPVA